MKSHTFITVLDQTTFQVSEIQAVSLNGSKIRVYLKDLAEPFEYDLQFDGEARAVFNEIVSHLQ